MTRDPIIRERDWFLFWACLLLLMLGFAVVVAIVSA